MPNVSETATVAGPVSVFEPEPPLPTLSATFSPLTKRSNVSPAPPTTVFTTVSFGLRVLKKVQVTSWPVVTLTVVLVPEATGSVPHW